MLVLRYFALGYENKNWPRFVCAVYYEILVHCVYVAWNFCCSAVLCLILTHDVPSVLSLFLFILHKRPVIYIVKKGFDLQHLLKTCCTLKNANFYFLLCLNLYNMYLPTRRLLYSLMLLFRAVNVLTSAMWVMTRFANVYD